MKFTVYAQITVSCFCEVEAETKEEALAKAEKLQPALSYNGSGTNAEENWLIEDADGTPQEIRIEES